MDASFARGQWLFCLALCLSFALGLMLENLGLVTRPTLPLRLQRHQQVLALQADYPYQYHNYLISHFCQALHDIVGLSFETAFALGFGLGYLALLLATWFMAAQLFASPAAIVIAIAAMAAYGSILMQWSYDHPADPLGAALFALSLGYAARQRFPAVLAVSVAAGFVWSKQVMLGPVLLIADGLEGRWRRGFVWASLGVAAALVGPAAWRLTLGYHPVTPKGILSAAEWLEALPRALWRQFAFSAAPLAALVVLRRRLPPIVRAAAVVYPVMLLLYGVQRLFWHELRSFWVVVPAFVALLAAWGEGAIIGEAGGIRRAHPSGADPPSQP